MSSFVINKEEYMKAAGLVAGIASVKRDQMSIFDYEARKWIKTPEEWREKFSECYTMNALSVQEQYNDPEPETDFNNYDGTFKKAYQAGINAAINMGLSDRIMQLRNFFHCAMYQTEKESYYFKMRLFFFSILDQLMQYMGNEPDTWGNIEI